MVHWAKELRSRASSYQKIVNLLDYQQCLEIRAHLTDPVAIEIIDMRITAIKQVCFSIEEIRERKAQERRHRREDQGEQHAHKHN